MIELDPVSPFSDRKLSELVGEYVREGDAWVEFLINKDYPELHTWIRNQGAARHFGSDWSAAGPLMEHEAWPQLWSLYRSSRKNAKGWIIDDADCDILPFVCEAETPTLAIRQAFIIAAVNAANESAP